MHADGINRRRLCNAAVAVILVGISKSITTSAAAESKPKPNQTTRVPPLLDEKGMRNFHACRTLPELSEGDLTGLWENISAE